MDPVELVHYFRLVRRWWWLLVAGVIVGAGGAYGVSQAMTPIYRASATLLVNQTQTPGVIAYNDVLASERLTKTYGELITKDPVLETVIDDLGLQMSGAELRGMIDVKVVPDTQLLRLSFEDAAPGLASELANAVSAAFIASNNEDGLTRPGTVTIVEPAATPASPVRPRTEFNALLGGLAGLFLVCVCILIYEYLDDTIKTPDDVEEVTGTATLGGVTRFPKASSIRDTLVVASGARSPAAEAYRVLRTNLQFGALDAQTLLITSASPREGKSTTTANLAAAIAQTGQRVIVVDADLRSPSQHHIFGLTNGVGLTSALLSPAPEVTRFLQPTQLEGLSVLTSGPLPPNPSELLGSWRMEAVIAALKQAADIILFDSPPVLAVADASILAGRSDVTVVVVDAGRTRAQALRRTTQTLQRTGTRSVGAVLNRLTERTRGYNDYAYYYYGASANGHDRQHRRWLPWPRKPSAREETFA